MKKIVIFLVFVYVLTAFAVDIDAATKLEIKILEKLVLDITGKKNPLVYFIGLSKKKVNLLTRYSVLKKAKTEASADFVFIKDINKKFYATKPTVALDYSSFKKCENCIGLFTWRNGRPILLLIEENLIKFHISLPEDYKYFIESKNFNIGKK
ncbi:hypothetical protein [Persephonella sp. IF05-L8]|uniref:hypothetical protein n=1 Tax=Persephonella sp. IF05-L8 TaxID=1158338 RepID=UPI000494F9EC